MPTRPLRFGAFFAPFPPVGQSAKSQTRSAAPTAKAGKAVRA